MPKHFLPGENITEPVPTESPPAGALGEQPITADIDTTNGVVLPTANTAVGGLSQQRPESGRQEVLASPDNLPRESKNISAAMDTCPHDSTQASLSLNTSAETESSQNATTESNVSSSVAIEAVTRSMDADRPEAALNSTTEVNTSLNTLTEAPTAVSMDPGTPSPDESGEASNVLSPYSVTGSAQGALAQTPVGHTAPEETVTSPMIEEVKGQAAQGGYGCSEETVTSPMMEEVKRQAAQGGYGCSEETVTSPMMEEVKRQAAQGGYGLDETKDVYHIKWIQFKGETQ